MKNSSKYLIITLCMIPAFALTVFFCKHAPTTLFDAVVFSAIMLAAFSSSLYIALFTGDPDKKEDLPNEIITPKQADNISLSDNLSDGDDGSLPHKINLGQTPGNPVSVKCKCGAELGICIDTSRKKWHYRYSKCKKCYPEGRVF